jgi:hypothetical protein
MLLPGDSAFLQRKGSRSNKTDLLTAPAQSSANQCTSARLRLVSRQDISVAFLACDGIAQPLVRRSREYATSR